jgi:VIT1/CCC1 family predicted Fe2+/Mn2+ transporter
VSTGPDTGGRKPVLDPIERLSEVLFGIIMALTFTGSIHAASAGEEEIRQLLYGAIGCNIAWGIVDGVMYVVSDLVARNRSLLLLRSLRGAKSPEEARAILSEVLPTELAAVLGSAEFDQVHRWTERLPDPPPGARITGTALRGAFAVFLLVSLSTFPMVVPFLLISDPGAALRGSHAIALALLFTIGVAFGRHSGQNPLRTGLWMLGIGVALVAVALALGG